MLIPSSKTGVTFYYAEIGDTFIYKSKEYVIIGKEYDLGFMVYQCVKTNPRIAFSIIHELYKD